MYDVGGPAEICLPLNIAFAPSTWVAGAAVAAAVASAARPTRLDCLLAYFSRSPAMTLSRALRAPNRLSSSCPFPLPFRAHSFISTFIGLLSHRPGLGRILLSLYICISFGCFRDSTPLATHVSV